MDVFAKIIPITDRNLRLEALELRVKYKVSEKQLFFRRFQTILIHRYDQKLSVYDNFVQQAYNLYKDDEKLKKIIEEEVLKNMEDRTRHKTSEELIHIMKTKKLHIVIKDK